MHAPWQEVTGGHDGPRGGGSRRSSSAFGLQPERHAPAGPLWNSAHEGSNKAVLGQLASPVKVENPLKGVTLHDWVSNAPSMPRFHPRFRGFRVHRSTS